MIKGHPTESHANFITGGDFAGSQENPGTGSVDNAGYVYVNGYGPYTIGYGDSVKIILVEGASGLSRDESIRIGKLYKSGNISVLEKNNWVLTGADSLRQTFERITDAFDNNWNIPQAPYPPETFSVNSNQGKVDLEWTTFSEGPTIQGFEIYRNTQEQVDGYVSDVWFSKYELIAELGAEIREYTDTTQSLNIPVHYYIVSVGDEVPANVNLNIPAHTLKSNRSYTQTYLPAHRLVVSVDEPENVLREFQLNQNYPNPFNPVTTITYTIPQTGFVQLKVYDLLGREAANLVSEEQTAGSYKVEFDASSLSSGIYFYRLQSGSFMDFKKLTLLR
ncbi:MAG: T9SS type A sorting domain-containing protein [Ignavibacteriae bacterium]|nr:T9SS C-terminal target domain-containing protein [Ignavibacteriota bacterium]NOG99500.1 T9SS type A sorting domain-containing protein [Ignavibacteriota bacterium]